MNAKLGWRELSIGYIFSVVQSGHFTRGMDTQLHPETKTYLNFILNTLQKYQKFPTFQHLQEYYNLTYEYHALPNYTREELCDRIRLEKAKYDAMSAIAKIQKVLTVEGATIPDLLKPLMQLQGDLFNASNNNEVFRLSEFANILRYYREQGGEKVCEYGIRSFDAFTGGICAGDFIVVYANTGQGKSTLARHLSGNIAKQGKIVLYFTLEESGRKSVLKALSTQIHTPVRPLIESTYDHETYQKLAEFSKTGLGGGDVLFVDRLETGSIAEISRWVHEVSPDIIVVDQIPHLVRDSNRALYEAITRISSELRQFSQSYKIPMIALTQANRLGMKKNATLEETMSLAYAQAQDASHIIFGHSDEEAIGYIRKRWTFLKNRDGEAGLSVDLKWQIGEGILEEEIVSQSFYGQGGAVYAPITGSTTVNASVRPNTKPEPVPTINGAAVGSGPTGSVGIQQQGNSSNSQLPQHQWGGENASGSIPDFRFG